MDEDFSAPSHFQQLHRKWTVHHSTTKEKLLKKHRGVLHWLLDGIPHKQHIAATALSALMVLIPPMPQFHAPDHKQLTHIQEAAAPSIKNQLKLDLQNLIPDKVDNLTPQEETQISYILSRDTNMRITPELQGIHLDRTYGLIGGEQHLLRHSADTLQQHATTTDERIMFLSSGMAPNKGSFGYFTQSNQLTEQDIQREKYYIALPYNLIDGYNQNVETYKSFFQFRKMLVVNPQTGSAVVTVVGDCGPGQSTGKHLGGSPEVMHALDLSTGSRKGAVLYFFIDDPNDTIPLGALK